MIQNEEFCNERQKCITKLFLHHRIMYTYLWILKFTLRFGIRDRILTLFAYPTIIIMRILSFFVKNNNQNSNTLGEIYGILISSPNSRKMGYLH